MAAATEPKLDSNRMERTKCCRNKATDDAVDIRLKRTRYLHRFAALHHLPNFLDSELSKMFWSSKKSIM